MTETIKSIDNKTGRRPREFFGIYPFDTSFIECFCEACIHYDGETAPLEACKFDFPVNSTYDFTIGKVSIYCPRYTTHHENWKRKGWGSLWTFIIAFINGVIMTIIIVFLF